MPKISIMGPQGSGKTTQAKLLADNLAVPLIDVGAHLRNIAQQKSDSGEAVRKSLLSGELVDNQVVADLVRELTGSEKCQNGFVMDGYPRSLNQLKMFDPGFDRVFYLDVPDEVVEIRLLKRGRSDDTPDLIKKRLERYHQLTEEVLTFFQDQGLLQKIDGTQTEKEIHRQIKNSLPGALHD